MWLKACLACGLLSLTSTLSACGDNVLGRDIRIQVDKSPNLRPRDVVVWRRADGGEWLRLQPNEVEDGRLSYSFNANEYYSIWISCPDSSYRPAIRLTNATPDELSLVAYSCDVGGVGMGTSFRATGIMVQPGVVAAGLESQSGNVPSWNFDIDVGRDRGDVVALAGDRVMIRRDVDFFAHSDLGVLDVTREGDSLKSVLATIEGDPGGNGTFDSWVVTAGGTTVLLKHGAESSLAMLPDSMMDAVDRHYVHYNKSFADRRFVGLEQTYSGPMQAVLMPLLPADLIPISALEGFTLPQDPVLEGAAWTLIFEDEDALQHVMTTYGWVDATAATTVTLESPSDVHLSPLQGSVGRSIVAEISAGLNVYWSGVTR